MQVMLATQISNVKKLRYPVYASVKLDGIRAFIHKEDNTASVVMSRSMNPIPNEFVQKNLRGEKPGLDGELIYGDPNAKDCYCLTLSIVMSEHDPRGADVDFYIFDKVEDKPFEQRYNNYCAAVKKDRTNWQLGAVHYIDALGVSHTKWQGQPSNLRAVRQTLVFCVAELLAFEKDVLAHGGEGVMVRDPQGPYKHGRSTEREGWLLKVKRFVDADAEVYDFLPLYHNANAAFKDALGHTKRSLSKAGKVPLPLLGRFLVRDCKSKVEFEVGVGFTMRQRRKMWKELQANPLAYNGRIMKYKHFPHGAKNKPRHAIFLGWRSKLDMDAPSPTGRLNVPSPAIQNIPIERVPLENLAHAPERPKRNVAFTMRCWRWWIP
jgi:DNA ligase-1